MLIFDKKRETFQIVGYKQFDSSEPLKVKFLNNGRPIDLSQYYIRLECKKPDGTIVVDDENITIKNVCELEMYLNEQVTVVSGKVKCQFVLVNKTNEKQSTTFTFIMDIQQSVIGINGYSQSVITIAERLNKDVIKAENLHKNLTDDITVGTPLQANLRKDINEGKPLSEQLGKDIATGTVLNANLGRNIVDGNKTNEDLTVSLESAKGSVELIKGTGNENKIITSTSWTLNSDGHYEHTWTHNLNSTNIIIAMFDNDTKESLNYTYQVVDANKIKILSDVQKNVKVVLNVQYYSGGMGIKEDFKEAKNEIEEARGTSQFLVDRLDIVDYQLNTVSASLEQKANNIDLETAKSRIDQFTKLQEGSTTGDAELQDIRIGLKGEVYPNAGESIRKQISMLLRDIDGIKKTYSENRYNKNDEDNKFASVALQSYILNTNGEVEIKDGVGSIFSTSGYIKTNKNTIYYGKILNSLLEYFVNASVYRCALYDKNKKFIKMYTEYSENFDTGENGEYIRICHPNSLFDVNRNLMILSSEYISSHTFSSKENYVPYREITTLNDVSLKYLSPIFFGAIPDGVTDCTYELQKTIDFAYDNKISSINLGEGIYLTSKPLYLYEKIALIGDSQYTTIINKINSSLDIYGHNSIIVFKNKGNDDLDSGYQQLKRLCIRGNLKDYISGKVYANQQKAVYAEVNTPYVIVEEVETEMVDEGIDLKGAWIGRFSKLKLRGHYTTFRVRNECQGIYINALNLMASHEYGMYLSGSQYNSINSVFVEWAYGGTAFAFSNGFYNVNGIGVELSVNMNRMVSCFEAYVDVKTALIPLGSTASYEALYATRNSILRIGMSEYGFTNVATPVNNGKLYNVKENSKLIIEFSKKVNEYPVLSAVDETSSVSVI